MRCGGLEELGHGDRGGERGVLDQRDEGVGERRHRDLGRLRQDGAGQRLAPAHADRVGRLPLAAGDGVDGGADDLRAVGADVEGEADQRGGEGVEVDADARQAVEDHEELDEERGAAEDPDVEAGEEGERPRAEEAEERGAEAEGEAEGEGEQRQRDGEDEARPQERGQRLDHELKPGGHHGGFSFGSGRDAHANAGAAIRIASPRRIQPWLGARRWRARVGSSARRPGRSTCRRSPGRCRRP